MSLPSSLLKLREARHMTQRALADRSGLAVSYISRIENGRLQPTLATLKRLARGLGVSVGEIFLAEEGGKAPEPHRCPVSASGQCVGELIRSGRGRKPDRGPAYGPRELQVLRMADYIVLHATEDVKRSFRLICESLVNFSQEQGTEGFESLACEVLSGE